MANENFTSCFKITIKWNLTKSHTTRLKSTKYNSSDTSATLKMNELLQNELTSRQMKSLHPVSKLLLNGT